MDVHSLASWYCAQLLLILDSVDAGRLKNLSTEIELSVVATSKSCFRQEKKINKLRKITRSDFGFLMS